MFSFSWKVKMSNAEYALMLFLVNHYNYLMKNAILCSQFTYFLQLLSSKWNTTDHTLTRNGIVKVKKLSVLKSPKNEKI